MKKSKTELTNQDLLEAIQGMDSKIDSFRADLSKEIRDVNDTLSEAIQALATDMDHRFELADEKNSAKFQDITTTLDYLTNTTLRIREDHLAGIEWLKRHERQLDRHELDIRALRHSS